MSRLRAYTARAGFVVVESVGIYLAGKGTDLPSVAAGAGCMVGAVVAMCAVVDRGSAS